MILVDKIGKTYRTHRKAPGLWGSIRSLVTREWLDKVAVQDVSFKVNAGEILGLVGANGAGKTTLIKMLSGIIHPDSGGARVLGFTPWERGIEFRRQISLIMGQKAQLWWDLPAADCFLLLREIYQIDGKTYQRTLDELVSVLDVSALLHIPVRNLSLGERMKMELIAALLHSPKVIFLDEPTIGLDIMAQRSMRSFILEYCQRHKPAIILTSHYMEDIEELCPNIVILRAGRLVYSGALEGIRAQLSHTKIVTIHTDSTSAVPNRRWESGTLVESASGLLRFKVEREKLRHFMNEVLSIVEAHDVSIEEADISDTIAALMKGKAQPV
ncbi:MAG: ATP-binding cassette domain-containing protein [Oligoflexia bacterium]|nr:ATP-binding cassette domain-containing protein [Oligoflexia bacterium]